MVAKGNIIPQMRISTFDKEAMNELSEIVNKMSLVEDLCSSKLLEVSQRLDEHIMDYYYCYGKKRLMTK